jgi:RNA polymerase sigma factor (sigma-70 family)
VSDIDPERAKLERNLVARAVKERHVEKRAHHWAERYRPRAKEDDLLERGNFELAAIVREHRHELGNFDNFCKRRLDWAMIDSFRVEARHLRNDRAAQRAAADLLALYRADPSAFPPERLASLAQALAAATFAAMTEEAQRGGEDDLIAREEYATAHVVMNAVLVALTSPQRRLFVLLYQEDKNLREAQEALGVHVNTVTRWHQSVLAEIRKQLEKHGITHAPGRGGAPRVELSVLRGGKEEEPRR